MEAVRRGIASAESFWALLDEDVVWEIPPEIELPDIPRRVVGREEVIAGSRHYWGTWDEYRLDAEELIDAGSSVVLVVQERGRGRGQRHSLRASVGAGLDFPPRPTHPVGVVPGQGHRSRSRGAAGVGRRLGAQT